MLQTNEKPVPRWVWFRVWLVVIRIKADGGGPWRKWTCVPSHQEIVNNLMINGFGGGLSRRSAANHVSLLQHKHLYSYYSAPSDTHLHLLCISEHLGVLMKEWRSGEEKAKKGKLISRVRKENSFIRFSCEAAGRAVRWRSRTATSTACWGCSREGGWTQQKDICTQSVSVYERIIKGDTTAHGVMEIWRIFNELIHSFIHSVKVLENSCFF